MDVHATPLSFRAEAFDRLADGSLTADERSVLLARINAEPDGWRHCALAFLEAQAWREAIGTMTTQPSQSNAPSRSRERVKVSTGSHLFPIALAAGLIGAAFLLGRLTVETKTIPQHGLATVTRTDQLSDPIEQPVPQTDELEAAEDLAFWGDQIQAIGFVSMPMDAGPEAPFVDLPVLTGPGLDDRWLRDQPSFVPEEFRRSWEQLGYEVESQRRLVSVQIDEEGRYLTIPVDEVLFRSKVPMTY